MKFLCLDCDQPMKLHETAGPDEGSLTVTFRCPECGFRVAMLTNPFETQMVRSLGVKVGGQPVPPDPFAGGGGVTETSGPGCPFAAAFGESQPAAAPSGVAWTSEAEARLERIPSFIRPMARRSIERFAGDKGYATITEAVMDEAKTVFGM